MHALNTLWIGQLTCVVFSIDALYSLFNKLIFQVSL